MRDQLRSRRRVESLALSSLRQLTATNSTLDAVSQLEGVSNSMHRTSAQQAMQALCHSYRRDVCMSISHRLTRRFSALAELIV